MNIAQLLRDREDQLAREPGNFADANRRLINKLTAMTRESEIMWRALTTEVFHDGLSSSLNYFATRGTHSLLFSMNLCINPASAPSDLPTNFNFTVSIIGPTTTLSLGDGIFAGGDPEDFDDDDPRAEILGSEFFASAVHLSELYNCIASRLGEMALSETDIALSLDPVHYDTYEQGPTRDDNGLLYIGWTGEGYDSAI